MRFPKCGDGVWGLWVAMAMWVGNVNRLTGCGLAGRTRARAQPCPMAPHVCACVPLGCGSTCVWPILLMFHVCVTHWVAAPHVCHSLGWTSTCDPFKHQISAPRYRPWFLFRLIPCCFCKPNVSYSLSELDCFPQVPGETYSKSHSLKKKGSSRVDSTIYKFPTTFHSPLL